MSRIPPESRIKKWRELWKVEAMLNRPFEEQEYWKRDDLLEEKEQLEKELGVKDESS